MRALLLLVLCACAAAPPRPVEVAADWAQGRSIYVADVQSTASGVDSTYPISGTRAVAPSELRAIGFAVVTAPEPGGLEVAFNWTARGTLDCQFRRAGLLIADFSADVDGDHLGCYSGAWALQTDDNCRCLVREVLRKAAGSQEFASKLDAPRPQQQAATGARRWHGKLAVLDLRSYSKDVPPDNVRYFTDLVRSATLQYAPGLEVMTRENVIVLLQSTGRKLEDCEGECEVDTGRRLGADFIVTGEIQKVGRRLKISLRLHGTRGGRLLSSTIASGNSVDDLDDSANKAVESLYTQAQNPDGT